MKYKIGAMSLKTIWGTVMLIIVSFLIILSIIFVQSKIVENADNLGTSLVESYAMEEEFRLYTYENILFFAKQYIDDMDKYGEDNTDEIQKWLEEYFVKIENTIGKNIISPYAVIDGKIVAATPWKGDKTYDYSKKDWYINAVEANGKTIYSDVYCDDVTNKDVYTISKQLEKKGNVIAIDIYIDSNIMRVTTQTLPENGSLYICDKSDNLIYAYSYTGENIYNLPQYVEGILNNIKYEKSDLIFERILGNKKCIYYKKMYNDWTIILTMPFNNIFMNENNYIIYLLFTVWIILFIILVILLIRDFKQSKIIKSADSTIQALSNAYVAIYKINFIEKTYEAIKKANTVDINLPIKGCYDILTEKISEITSEQTYEELKLNYSIENIKKRIDDGVMNYGGDYRILVNNEYKWVNIHIIYNEKISKDEVILCFKEVDAEKKKQLQNMIFLQDAVELSKKNAKAKSDFFSHMSHDMRTPLNSILGFTELSNRNIHDENKVKYCLEKIEFSGKQLLKLINDILEISKIESGKTTLNNKKFNIKEYIEDHIDMFKEQAVKENKSIYVNINIKNEIVIGDSFKISQVINNLLSNAFKYTNKGDEISVELKQFNFNKHSKYQIIVKDTGIGMSKNFINNLYLEYTRETEFLNKEIVGTGLGMFIVRSVVQQMSGEISVKSELGKGSTFIVTIPLEVVCDKEYNNENNIQHKKLDLSGYRILVAEDNKLNMEIITEILQMYGCEVLQAFNGKDALDIFNNSDDFDIDAILMDMHMPIMDGCQATVEIRKLNKKDANTIPIIAVTANAFAEDIDKTTKAGMNGHISKPIDVVVLCRILDDFIKK